MDSQTTRSAKEWLELLRPIADNASADDEPIVDTALEQLAALDQIADNDSVVHCLLACVRFFFFRGKTAEAFPHALHASDVAKRIGDVGLILRTIDYECAIRIEIGDLPTAIARECEALSLTRRLVDPKLEVSIWNNLGAALVSTAQFREALKCFERAYSLAPKDGSNVRHQFAPLTNMALCAWYLGELTIGLRSAKAAIELNQDLSAVENCENRVECEFLCAALLLEAGEIEQAQVHCAAARVFATRFSTSRCEYLLAITDGLLNMYLGETEAGTRALREALKIARKGVDGDVRAALRVCAIGFEVAGQPDVALEYLRQWLALNLDLRTAQTRMHCSLIEAGVTDVAVNTGVAQGISRDLVRLQAQLDAKVERLVDIAINASLASGYDVFRIFRISKLAALMASGLGWTAEECERVALAAKLYDIGMVAVADPLLNCRRCLTPAERSLVAEHTRVGADLLTDARLDLLVACVPVARFHHEWWDGSGHSGLAGQEIPIGARLISLCDTFDALTHDRPWRPRLQINDALVHVQAGAGSQFDPGLAAAFVATVRNLTERENNLETFLRGDGQSHPYVQSRERLAALIETAQ